MQWFWFFALSANSVATLFSAEAFGITWRWFWFWCLISNMADNAICTKCNLRSQKVLTHNKALKWRLRDSEHHFQCIHFFKDELNVISLSLTHWYCTLYSGHIWPCYHFIDDGDFVSTLYDIISSELLNLDCLKDMVFNTFVLNDDVHLPLFN